MFVQDDRLYRIVQNAEKAYGDSFDLYEITALSTTAQHSPIARFTDQRVPSDVSIIKKC
jgi:hypothetical protein